ncbi:MAG: alpha/beta hydrolase [Candidatus Aminicenantes bacterium]|nr:alpha/beta hydrolase [Candidatus Aminicenantes bacterium]
MIPSRRQAWGLGALFVLLAALPSALPAQDGPAAEFFRHLPAYRVRLEETPASSSFFAAFRVAGPESGRTIVLLHGICATSAAYAELARDLASDFRVILVDLPGYGDSFTDKPVSYDYERMTARLLTVLRAAGALEGAVLVGHSTGGGLAWHLELTEECKPAGLVLIDAITVGFKLPIKPGLAFELAKRNGLAGPMFNLTGNAAIMDMIARGSAAKWGRPVPTSAADGEPMFTTPARLRVNRLWAIQMLARPVVAAWEPKLKEIVSPTLLIWGADDGVLKPEVMARALDLIPGARGEIIEGAGHSPQQEKPERVAALIREFASGLPPATGTPSLGPEAVPADPADLARPRPETRGRMVHATISLTGEPGRGLVDAASFHLKHGYYSTEYPSQSGSAGVFLEAERTGTETTITAGSQLELVWEKWGGFRIAGGWTVAGGGHASLLRIGYVPSYVPWLCLGAAWHGGKAGPVFFATIELSPKLYR